MGYFFIEILIFMVYFLYPVKIVDSHPNHSIHSDQNESIKNLISPLFINKGDNTNSTHKGMFYTFGINKITDSSAKLYKSLGGSSVETYVTWQTCEPDSESQWDWSEWDRTVNVLKRNNLKWVPFLILGPAYSTPNWFRESNYHIPCRCLEHGIASKVESRWNPFLPKWIDRFLKAFSNRYKNSGVIESVLLGIQGDYGEAIYSVTGGGWTFNIPGEYHNHPGFWCNDIYALADFRKIEQEQYGDIKSLNKAWDTGYDRFNEVNFPGYSDSLRAFEAKVKLGNNPQVDRRWLDFISWYRGAMTRWADLWLSETRKYFPHTPIYLCTGGDAEPRHGSNFAEQARVAAKHHAGIRITNEASDYAKNLVGTRWVASAGKHYGAYYGFEPAGAENEKGIIARIYNATASGANQLHDYVDNVTRSSKRMKVQRDNMKYLFHTHPVVPVALWYPNISLTLDWNPAYLENASTFRDYTDFDFVDESMLHTGALDAYRILVVIWGKVMEREDAEQIADWVKKGGRLIVMNVSKIKDVEGTTRPGDILFGYEKSKNSIHNIGKGDVERVKGWEHLKNALRTTLSELNLPICDLKKDSIFVTHIDNQKWLILNTTDKSSTLDLKLPKNDYEIVAKSDAITLIEKDTD